MISAACPHCKILVVEASSPYGSDLARSEDTAARLGAQVISNSYGIRETGFSQAYARAYQHRGHMIVASAGDGGFDAANFPANLATVTAVGGTTLSRARNARGFTERVWDQRYAGYAGSSGCSAYVRRPSWQHSPALPRPHHRRHLSRSPGHPDLQQGLGRLANGRRDQRVRAADRRHLRPGRQRRPHHRPPPIPAPRDFFDVTRGNNVMYGNTTKQSCGDDYLCTAKPGYDAPTGLGTPNGTGAF